MDGAPLVCAICGVAGSAHEFSTIGTKGSEGINRASGLRNDSISVAPGQHVHPNCRRDYCHPTNISKDNRSRENAGSQSATIQRKRSADQTFDYKSDCYFCGNKVDVKSVDVCRVMTLETQETVLNKCNARRDTWAEVVKARILHVHDLPAAEAVYHKICNSNFRTDKQVPVSYATTQLENKKGKRGRPQNEEQNKAFYMVTEYLLKHSDEQITVQDLVAKMNEYSGDSDCTTYSQTYMKACLQKHFGEELVITFSDGKPNVVTFRKTAAAILNEFHEMEKDALDVETEKMNIIRTAAALIKSEIKLVETTTSETYPKVESDAEQQVEFLPVSLKEFLHGILTEDDNVKLASIGQTLMQAARPRLFLAPLQLGLAVQLHYHIASRFLIDTLNSLGYCASYNQLTPIMTDLAPAPQSLLQIMRCNCSQDCSTRRCSCRKNDLPCNPACGQCKGSACTNAPEQIPDDEDSDSDSG